jgi:hypothetical protein
VTDDAHAFLLDVRDLIEASWTQRAEARTADETPTDPWLPGAVSWSLLGALVAVYERRVRSEGEARALGSLARACALLVDVVDSDLLAAWNDAPGRTREDVLSALDDAVR